MADVDNQTLVGNRPNNALGAVVTKKLKQRFERVLSGFRDGQLSLTWPDGTTSVYGKRNLQPDNNAAVVLHSYQPLRRLITDGQIGFAESYFQGEWSTENLPGLFALIMRNDQHIRPVTRGGLLPRVSNIWRHWTKRNSISGSQRNIEYHYDLGNDFYKLWLDQSMSYSSAIYRSGKEQLEEAQQNKMNQILAMLAPEQNASILEIGCGWGSLANSLASKSGANVTGVSLSKQQLEYASAFNSEPAQGSSKFEYCDYREIQGQFDHIVSIEMFEAVGQQYWQTYFDKVAQLLNSGGTAVIQTITLAEDRFAAYRARPDFIQRYVFPGGMLPTKSLLQQHLQQAGFELQQSHWFGESYARTLAQWRERFEQASNDILSLNFDERFLRLWRYYLVYCETGFNIGRTDVGLLKIRKL